MAYASHLYGDPMAIVAGRQSRERKQAQEPRRDVSNSQIPEFPRRWTETEPASAWSAARERAEALFAGKLVETPAQSAARVAAELLFARL